MRRRDAAAGGELDVHGAAHELLAHAQADLVGAVGDGRMPGMVDERARCAERSRQIANVAEVTVPTGHRDDRARGIDARADHDAVVDDVLQREAVAAHVADGGEPAHQHAAGFRHGDDRHEAGIVLEVAAARGGHQHRVPVRVDEPRHEHPPTARDDRGARLGTGRDRPRRGDSLDLVAPDEDVRRSGDALPLPVEDADVLEQRDGTRRSGCRAARLAGHRGERRAQEEQGRQQGSDRSPLQVVHAARHLGPGPSVGNGMLGSTPLRTLTARASPTWMLPRE